MTDVMDMKIEKVVGKVDELQRNLMHLSANMELVLSGMSLLLNKKCLMQDKSDARASGHGHSHSEKFLVGENKSKGFHDLDSAGPQPFDFHDDPTEAVTPDMNYPSVVAPLVPQGSSEDWYGVDSVERINQITFCAACPVVSVSDDDSAEKVRFLETKLDHILAELDREKGRFLEEVHNCSDGASQTIYSSSHTLEDDLTTSISVTSDTSDIDETCVSDATSNTSKNDDAHMTKLDAISLNDELRVVKEVYAAEEKLTLIVGERYRVFHLDHASVKLEFLDYIMPNGASLTANKKPEDLVCFAKICD